MQTSRSGISQGKTITSSPHLCAPGLGLGKMYKLFWIWLLFYVRLILPGARKLSKLKKSIWIQHNYVLLPGRLILPNTTVEPLWLSSISVHLCCLFCLLLLINNWVPWKSTDVMQDNMAKKYKYEIVFASENANSQTFSTQMANQGNNTDYWPPEPEFIPLALSQTHLLEKSYPVLCTSRVPGLILA